MTVESQELVFTSEEERQAAIDNLPETPDNESQLDAIMSAPIKATDEAAENKSAIPEPEKTPVANETPIGVNAQTSATDQSNQTPPSVSDDVFQIKRSDLPEGFDNPNKVLKSYKEAQDLIKKQEKFIREKLGGDPSNNSGLNEVLRRAEVAETELAKVRSTTERSAQQVTRQENLSPIPPSNAVKIKELRQSLQKLSANPVANEEEIFQKRLELDDLWMSEMERNALLLDRATKRAEDAERLAGEVKNQTDGFVSKMERSEENKRNQEALNEEYRQMDIFATDPDYPEFKMSKNSQEVEKEYVNWGSSVARLFYGQPININTVEGNNLMSQALEMLKQGAPDIVEKCNMAGIPTTPTEDVQKYLDICDLLDYRDGYRVNPSTGKREVVKRYHAPTRQMVPDVFPSLKDAYENRKVRDGFYANKVREAYLDGGKGMAEAASRIDNGAVEMGNAAGAAKSQGMTVEDADQIINTMDETEAMRKKNAGDPSDYNKIQEAFRVKGIPVD